MTSFIKSLYITQDQFVSILGSLLCHTNESSPALNLSKENVIYAYLLWMYAIQRYSILLSACVEFQNRMSSHLVM